MSAVVFDFGSGSSRIGFAGEWQPFNMFPFVPSLPGVSAFAKPFVPHRDAHRGVLLVENPMFRGQIRNFEEMEQLIEFSFEHLKVPSEEHRVLLTESPLMSRRNHETMIEIMLEKFNVPGLHIGNQAVMSLHAVGETTGLVVDSGYSITTAVPVHDSRVIKKSIGTMKLGGKDLDELLVKQMGELCRETVRPFATEVKEKEGFVPLSFRKQTKNLREQQATLANGDTYTLFMQHFWSGEVLFTPQRTWKNMVGVHTVAFDSLISSQKSKKMLNNVVLSGGTTLMRGFEERFKKELTALAPLNSDVRVIAPCGRRNLSWLGGSYFASEPGFDKYCITSKDQQEVGSGAGRRKFLCF